MDTNTQQTTALDSGDLLALLRSGQEGNYDGHKSAQLMQQAADMIEALQKYWREEREKSVACEALNLLSVMRPIDWSFVFSAPMNGSHNAARITEAVERLEAAFRRANAAYEPAVETPVKNHNK